MYPSDRKYTKDHEWVKIDGPQARVGITDYAQKQLGDVVYLDLPEVGRTVNKGDSFGTVESVKAVSDLFAPVSGEVVEVNRGLAAAYRASDVLDEPSRESLREPARVAPEPAALASRGPRSWEEHWHKPSRVARF